jgi:methionine--tRNA ligase beta chain
MMITFDEFLKLDLRIALVKSAEAVPKTDKLVHLQLDIGEDELRNVVAGIREHYTPEDLLDKKVLYLANLAPRKLRGIESSGMVLAAAVCSDTELTGKVESLSLLLADKDVPPWTKVG